MAEIVITLTAEIVITLTQDEAKRVDYALADFLMWIQGYNAGQALGSGDKYPGDVRSLRELRDKLRVLIHD